MYWVLRYSLFVKFCLFFCRVKSFCITVWECMTRMTFVTLLSFSLAKSWDPKPLEMGRWEARWALGGMKCHYFQMWWPFKCIWAESPRWSPTGNVKKNLIMEWHVLLRRLINSFLCFISIWEIIVERQWANFSRQGPGHVWPWAKQLL